MRKTLSKIEKFLHELFIAYENTLLLNTLLICIFIAMLKVKS